MRLEHRVDGCCGGFDHSGDSMNEASQRGSWDALAMHLAEGVVLAGRFRLERAIGAGGMAEVWRAFDLHTERTVALKLLKAEVRSSAEAVQRLRREGEVLSALSHPAIVRVETYGQLESGVVFVAMELLEGETLGARMRRGPMQPAELAPIFAGTCAGLAAAHEKGIIHRDLKPDNIFLVASAGAPTVKLLDFGISKVFGEARLTYTGEILGTPRYMSPEQLRAESNIDGRVDIYALGVIAYEALVGRPPFLSSTPTDLIVAILHGKIAPLSAVRPDLGPGIDAVVTRAMARVPQARYANATEFFSAFLSAAGLAQTNMNVDVERARVGALRTQALGGMGEEPRSGEGTSRRHHAELRPGTVRALTMNEPSHPESGPSGTLHVGGTLHVESVGEHASGQDSRAQATPTASVARTLIEQELPSLPSQKPWERSPWIDPLSPEPATTSGRARILLAIAGLTAGAVSAGAVMFFLELWGRGSDSPIVNAPPDTEWVQEPSPSELPIDASSPALEEEEEPSVEVSSAEPPREPQVRERRRPVERNAPERGSNGAEQARPLQPLEAASRALAGGDPDACVTILDDFIEHGGTPFALKRRADCLMRAGRRADALRDYQRFCELVPDHPAVGTVREQLTGMGVSCP